MRSHNQIYRYEKILSFLAALSSSLSAYTVQPIHHHNFEQSDGKETPDYAEIIDWWKKLDDRSAQVKMLTMGMTDAGFPLHLVVLYPMTEIYNFESLQEEK